MSYSRIILYFPCPNPRISHISMKLWYHLLKNRILKARSGCYMCILITIGILLLPDNRTRSYMCIHRGTLRCLVSQSCLILCDPMDCSPPGSSVHVDIPGKNTGAGCHAHLQGIFLTQRINPGLPQGRRILYHPSLQESPRILEWVAHPFSRGIFLTQESNQGLLHCRQILYQLSYQESPISKPMCTHISNSFCIHSSAYKSESHSVYVWLFASP